MEPIVDFDTFYSQQLLPVLPELREQNLASRRWLMVAVASGVLGFTYLILYSYLDYSTLAPLFFLFVIFLVSIIFYINTKDDFQIAFKEKVIKKILHFIYPDIEYEPEKFVSSRHYRASALARSRYSNINGDDFFKGVYKNVSFKCSEVNSSYQGENIFSGLFFMAHISNYYNGGTYIWSRGNEQYADSVYTEHYRFYPMPKVINMKTGDPAFDKHFSVCSTYPAQARQILSDYRMQQMLNFCTKINADISFSFVGGYCYVAAPQGKGLFEAGKDPGDKQQIKQYFLSILLFLSFIDKLRLNEMQ
jgi:hypothetical protein